MMEKKNHTEQQQRINPVSIVLIAIGIWLLACNPVSFTEDTDPTYFVKANQTKFLFPPGGGVAYIYVTTNYEDITVEGIDSHFLFSGHVKKDVSENKGRFPAPANDEHKIRHAIVCIQSGVNIEEKPVETGIFIVGVRSVNENGKKLPVKRMINVTLEQEYDVNAAKNEGKNVSNYIDKLK